MDTVADAIINKVLEYKKKLLYDVVHSYVTIYRSSTKYVTISTLFSSFKYAMYSIVDLFSCLYFLQY